MSAGTEQATAEVAGGPATLRRFTAEQKQALLKAYDAWAGPMKEFCAAQGVSSTSLCAWRRAYQVHGAQGLVGGRGKPGPKPARHQGPYTPAARQQAVDAYQKSGMTLQDFAKVWKVSPRILKDWADRYEQDGARGLETPRRGGRRGRAPLSTAVTERIVAVKRAFPHFGLKRVRSFLGRFGGLKVSVGSVRKSVAAAGLPATPGPSPRRKKAIRFFERARPGELWQSDWTSFVLPRTQQRVYLIVFMDDHSRYIVSWGWHLGQRTEHVIEALREGMSRFGKPTEVLTDQGPQYFAWRGTSEFQQVLKREGIRHVVARSHHPQTLGKCERFWGTVAEEFWGRIPPVELEEVRARFAHFVAHYNHFRPHQGIGNLVPADKFFGAAPTVRATLEAALSANELHVAVDEAPRDPVYLAGRIGDQTVSLVGEKGKLVFHGADGTRRELSYDALGMGPGARKEGEDGRAGEEGGGNGDGGGNVDAASAAAGCGGQAEGGVQAAAAGGAGEGPAVERESGGTAEGARVGDDDPGVVAGAEDAGRGGEGAGVAGGAGEAALGGGVVGDGGGVAQAADADAQGGVAAGGGSGEAPETDRGSGGGDAHAQGAGQSPEGSSGEQGAGAGAGA